MAQVKEQIKTLEKELSNKEIANLSDAEFKTLVIRMPREKTEYPLKIKETVRAIQSEIMINISLYIYYYILYIVIYTLYMLHTLYILYTITLYIHYIHTHII